MMPFYCSNLWIWNIFIFFCDSIACVRACVCVCVCVYASQTSKIRHAIFLAEIVSRGYHVYCSNSWKTLVIHQPVQVSIETNVISKAYDPYCCKIVITWRDWVGAVTVDHIPHKILRFVYYFLQEGGSATITVVSIQYWMSPLPESGLELSIQMTLSHTSKHIAEKMNVFV